MKSLTFILMSLLFLTIHPINIQSESVVRNEPEIKNEEEETVDSGDGEIRVLHQPVFGQGRPSSFSEESDQRDPDEHETSSSVAIIVTHILPSPIVVYGREGDQDLPVIEVEASSEENEVTSDLPVPEPSNRDDQPRNEFVGHQDHHHHDDSSNSASDVITERRVEDTGTTAGKVMIWEEGVDLGTGDSATKNSNSSTAASFQSGDQLPSRDDDDDAVRMNSNVSGTVEMQHSISVAPKEMEKKLETEKTQNDDSRRSKNSANEAKNLELIQDAANEAIKRHAVVMWTVVIGFLASFIVIHQQSPSSFSSSFSFTII